MREIKFRGRDEHGDWHYGAFMGVFFDGVVAPIEYANIYDDGMANRVLPDTVGQYTELRDFEGREIYEGDVLRFQPPFSWLEDPPELNWLVYFDDEHDARFMLRADLPDGHRYLENFYALHLNDVPFHVIGNIHDNPELLENTQ